MPHATPLIETIVAGLGLAFVFALVAKRLGVSILVGYLLAGIAIGPHTPGFVGDQALADQLAEIGVILLMFGVGLHFSLNDLLSVRAVAIPGAIAQIAVATLLGLALALWLGWSVGGGLVFGLALSVASTVVLLRALQERKIVQSERGRIAVGWLIVEDIVMVLALVMLPALAPLFGGKAENGASLAGVSTADIAITLAITVAKIIAFFAVMLILGRRIIPAALHYVAHTGSRELFRLSVLAIALGAAFGAANLFGVSFALGAFLAGMILSESELSQQAAAESLPLRDAFAVLFFVSVGMLFDPWIIVTDPVAVLATVAIIVLGKSLAAYLIVRAFGHPTKTALTISASLAQIGEFSFILAGLGVSLALLPEQGRDLILAGALLSILINPILFAAIDRWTAAQKGKEQPVSEPGTASAAPPYDPPSPLPSPPPAPATDPDDLDVKPTTLSGHAVIIGYGRIGRIIAGAMSAAQTPVFVVDDSEDVVRQLRASGAEADCARGAGALDAAGIERAKVLFITVPDGFEAGDFVETARKIHPGIAIIARARSEADAAHLKDFGSDIRVIGETDIAKAMLDQWTAVGGSARSA